MKPAVREEFQQLCRAAVDGTVSPAEAARGLWKLAFTNVAVRDADGNSVFRPDGSIEGDDEAAGLWLVWGSLSDATDDRPDDPEAQAAVIETARAWLTVEQDADEAETWLRRVTLERGLRRVDSRDIHQR